MDDKRVGFTWIVFYRFRYNEIKGVRETESSATRDNFPMQSRACETTISFREVNDFIWKWAVNKEQRVAGDE